MQNITQNVMPDVVPDVMQNVMPDVLRHLFHAGGMDQIAGQARNDGKSPQ